MVIPEAGAIVVEGSVSEQETCVMYQRMNKINLLLAVSFMLSPLCQDICVSVLRSVQRSILTSIGNTKK